MTQDEIIEMANKAYGIDDGKPLHTSALFHLEAFAKLVEAKASAKEREACAKLIEEMPCDCCWPESSISVAEDFAEAIRARGEA